MSEEKTYACFQCKVAKPASEFSNKQLKLKGKRKCQACLASAPAAPAAGAEKSEHGKDEKAFRGGLFTDTKSKTIAKTVLAADVVKAQEKMSKEDVVNPDMDKFDSLLSWLSKGGAKYPHLVMKYYTVDYRGVHARKRLEKDELILEVPLPIIMTTEVAKDSEIGQKIQRSGCQLYSDHSWLAACLLQEKYNPQSKWKPYIDILPVHYRNVPIFFDDEDLKALKGSFTLKMISDRKVSLKLEYDNIVKHVPEFGKYHHLDFSWARVAVITRVFGFEVRGVKTEGLVAMADMLNHKRPNETSWTFDDSRNAFTITTTKRLLKNAQIFDSYGRKCNSRFFVNYGFALDFNEDNQVALFFNLPQDDPAAQIKHKILGGNRTRRFQIAFEHKERCTKKCMSWLRIAHATVEELPPKGMPENQKIDPISPANELRVMNQVSIAAQEILKTFDTTLEEDNKLLEDPDKKLTMNIRNCVVMRRGEKEILNAYLQLAEYLNAMKDMDFRGAQKYFRDNIKKGAKEPTIGWRMERYFEEFWFPLMQGKIDQINKLEEMNNSLGE
jgi:histone-lysine N-methyltransferase SETD3